MCTKVHCKRAVGGRVAGPCRRMRRVRTGALVHYQQTVRNEWLG